jgi:HD domain
VPSLTASLAAVSWSSFKGRVTWWSGDVFANRRRAAMARAAFYVLGGCGSLALLSLALPGPPERNEPLIGGISVAALVIAAVTLAGFDRLPEWFFHVAAASATLLITGSLLFAGDENTAFSIFFFLVVLYAFSFFATRLAVVHIGLIAVAEVVVMVVQPKVLTPDRAFLTLAVFSGSAYVILRANQQLRELVHDLVRAKRAIQTSREETIYLLSRAAEFRDEESGQHTRRVGEICFALAERLGLDEERAELIRIASPLHDVGKIAIPDRILLKPGPLTAGERAVMQEHTEMGYEILTGSGQRILDVAALIALTHHERWDGKGYPHGVEGDEIPIEGRIAAVADVFDALTNTRPYRLAGSLEDAAKAIRNGSGSQFDPQVVEAFVESLDEILEIHRRYSKTSRRRRGVQAVA